MKEYKCVYYILCIVLFILNDKTLHTTLRNNGELCLSIESPQGDVDL